MRRFASVRAVRSARNLQSWARCALHVGLHVHLVQIQVADNASCVLVLFAIWCRWRTCGLCAELGYLLLLALAKGGALLPGPGCIPPLGLPFKQRKKGRERLQGL